MPPRKRAKGEPAPDPTMSWKDRYRAEKVEAARRAAKWQQCPDCGEPTLYGLDGDTLAGPVRVDLLGWADQSPVFLRAVVALLTGRAVCSLHPSSSGAGELHDLDDLCLTKPRRVRLTVGHRCGDTTLHLPQPTENGSTS